MLPARRSFTEIAGASRPPEARGTFAWLVAMCALAATSLAVLPSAAQPGVAEARTALQRLEPAYLAAARADVASLTAVRRTVSLRTGYSDIRCVIHAHSNLSHDSRGTIAEIAAAARAVGVRAVFLTNHTKDDLDVIEKAPDGLIDGILFVPGAETRGYLVFPKDRRVPGAGLQGQALVDQVVRGQGMAFVCHPEERRDWSVERLTGMEVYNTHANFMEQRELLAVLQPRDAAGYASLLRILRAINQFPREAFGCFCGPPTGNLRHYDAKASKRPFAAIAANDSHQNVGYVFRGGDGGAIVVEDALGEKVGEVDTARYPIAKAMIGDPVPGKELLRTIIDPYPVSFGYVSTHVLAPSASAKDLAAGLKAARTYVAFDWLADPTGAAFVAESGRWRWTIGDTIETRGPLKLRVELPQKATIRAVRDGITIASEHGHSLALTVDRPGAYRFEAELRVGGEPRPWIYTGAIRVVRPPDARVRVRATTRNKGR